MNISRTVPIFLIATILVFGTTISMGIPTSFAQYYEDSYGKDQKSSKVNLQQIQCNNDNTNVNGLDVNRFQDLNDVGAAEAQQLQNNGVNSNGNDNNGLFGNGLDIDRNLVNFCINVNANGQVAEEEPLPSQVTTMYVTNLGDNTVEIYDISNPTVPVRVGEFGAGDLLSPVGIAIQGTTLYVTKVGDSTVEIYDISNPSTPVRVGEFGAGDLDGPVFIAIQESTL